MLMKALCFVAVLALSEAAAKDLSRHGSRTKFTLYAKEDFRKPYEVATTSELLSSPFNPDLITVILVPDSEMGYDFYIEQLKDEILKYHDANVITLDWSGYTGTGYDNAVSAVPNIATYLSEFIINPLLPAGAKTENMHLVGFGLGAHICGIAGRDMKGDLARITGLDPSGKHWGVGSRRLSISDAKYVEVIHTDGFGLTNYGIGDALGHVDFYINGGNSQPGCILHKCCHNRAVEIMAASMGHSILGNWCSSPLQNNMNLCKGQTLEVGTNSINKRGAGIYRANTGRSFPFVKH